MFKLFLLLLYISGLCESTLFHGHNNNNHQRKRVMHYGKRFNKRMGFYPMKIKYDMIENPYESYPMPKYGGGYGMESYGDLHSFESYGHNMYEGLGGYGGHGDLGLYGGLGGYGGHGGHGGYGKKLSYQLPYKHIPPQVLEVKAPEQPVKVLFITSNSPVYVKQVHKKGGRGKVQSTRTHEEPHKLYHEVIRPVIQEIKEVIIPFRRVIQKIEPVVEDIQTIVAAGDGRKGGHGYKGGDHGYKGGDHGYKGGEQHLYKKTGEEYKGGEEQYKKSGEEYKVSENSENISNYKALDLSQLVSMLQSQAAAQSQDSGYTQGVVNENTYKDSSKSAKSA